MRLRRPLSIAAAALLAAVAIDASAARAQASPPAPASAPAAPVHVDTVALRRAVEGMMRGYEGVAGMSVRGLRTGEGFSVRGDETFPSASLIKVSVLVTLLDEVRKGTLSLDERSTLIRRDRVPGDGVLTVMDGGLQPTLGDLARLMISISDNTATNLLLDKLNIRTTWAKMDSLGLPHTRIHSKVYLRVASVAVDSSVKYGLGVTTPNEMVRLFSLLDEGRAVSPALDSVAIGMLRDNRDLTKLVRWLPETISAAHKTGEVDQSRNDCGILYGPEQPIAVCVMTRENKETTYGVDNPAHLLIARIGREVFHAYNPSVALPALPRI
ncbi:MAG: putative beta-lactamase precursor [Gemmatimonadetes bacterium]|nr:putative beta-lactamase precursor [Gemmatimonadota bacterium]